VGRFWGYYSMRPCLIAHRNLIEALLLIKTFDAVQKALDNGLHMLRLGRSDDANLSQIVPFLQSRLSYFPSYVHVVNAYDFVKAWAITSPNSEYV
jgi:hypothetical protein